MLFKDFRKKVLSRRSWGSVDLDSTAREEINDALNDAVKKLAGDCPGAFTPSVDRVVLHQDHTQDTLGRKVSITSDPYVMTLGVPVVGYPNPLVTGVWDGVYHVEAQDSSGRWYRRQCREFWLQAGAPYDGEYCFSLDRPWHNTTDTGMNFRLYTPRFYFKDDVTEVLDGRWWDAQGERIIQEPSREAQIAEKIDFQGKTKGAPQFFVREEYYQLDAPKVAPTLSLLAQDASWIGKEPVGKFRAYYTYVWGRKDAENQDQFGGYEPLWESGPSPVSNQIDLPDGNSTIKFSNLTNIDYMIGFDPAAAAGIFRNGHSGLRKRIYVVRDTTSTVGAFVDEVEPMGVPHLLVEVEGTTTSYTWNGSVTPNYFRRMPEVQGYFAHRMYPNADQRYEVDFRVRRRPRLLIHDHDAPTLPPDCEEALVLLGLYFVAQLDRQPEEATRALKLYYGVPGAPGELGKLQARYGNTPTTLQSARWGVSAFKRELEDFNKSLFVA